MITTIKDGSYYKNYIDNKTLKTIFTNKIIKEKFSKMNGCYVWGEYNIFLYDLSWIIDEISNGVPYRFLNTDKTLQLYIEKQLLEINIKKTNNNKEIKI